MREDIFAPPLKSAAKSSMMVAMHFVKGRRPAKLGKVAWVTSGVRRFCPNICELIQDS